MPGLTASRPFGEADGKITLWSLIRGGFSALITEFGIIVGYIVLPFSLADVRRLLRLLGLHPVCSRPARSSNDAELNTWDDFTRAGSRICLSGIVGPLLVNTLWSLMTAVHLNNPQSVLAQGDFWGSFRGVESTLLLSLASIIFALLIATIPMTARRILLGEYSPVGAAIAWGRAAASKALAGGAIAATRRSRCCGRRSRRWRFACCCQRFIGSIGRRRHAHFRRRCGYGRRWRRHPRCECAVDGAASHTTGVRGHSLVRSSARRRKHALQRKGQRYSLFVRRDPGSNKN